MVRASERRNLKRELRERYAKKLERFGRSRRTRRSRDYREYRDCRRDSFRCHSHDRDEDRHVTKNERRDHHKRDDNKPRDGDKGFTPCHIHGERCKHSFDECRENPKNRTKKYSPNKHVSHHVESRYSSDSDSSSATTECTSQSSDDKSKSSRASSAKKDETFHLNSVIRVPKKRKVSHGHKGDKKRHKKEKRDSFSFLADEFGPDMAAKYLKNLEEGKSSPIVTDDVINPLDFRGN